MKRVRALKNDLNNEILNGSIGIPVIKDVQSNNVAWCLSLTTIATFFSALTASMLALSINTTNDRGLDAINTIWFLSLVFSIASAVNSLLWLTWLQSQTVCVVAFGSSSYPTDDRLQASAFSRPARIRFSVVQERTLAASRHISVLVHRRAGFIRG